MIQLAPVGCNVLASYAICENEWHTSIGLKFSVREILASSNKYSYFGAGIAAVINVSPAAASALGSIFACGAMGQVARKNGRSLFNGGIVSFIAYRRVMVALISGIVVGIRMRVKQKIRTFENLSHGERCSYRRYACS